MSIASPLRLVLSARRRTVPGRRPRRGRRPERVSGSGPALAGLVAAAALALGARSALALHDSGVFELDGNSVSVFRDDFDSIYAGTAAAYDRSFVDDSARPDGTHHDGDNRDSESLAAWKCIVKQDVGDKTDIRFAYSGAYAVGGQAVEFFGLNRNSNAAATSVGLWFLQQAVTCNPKTGKFSGYKSDGDLLVVSQFVGGGSITDLKVYRWSDPNGVVEDGDEFLGDGSNAWSPLASGTDCRRTPDPPGHHAASPDLCTTANGVPVGLAWEPASVGATKFLEGGINLSALAPETCFSSYLAETRGSTALDAKLYDFAIGQIRTCGRVTIDESTMPAGSSTLFDFAVTGGPEPIFEAFRLADASAPHTTRIASSGSYAITETVPAGWASPTASCAGGPFGGGGAYTNGVPLFLDVGQEVTCTFFNSFGVPGPTCGNGVTDPGEQCDDGDAANGDCCSNACRFESSAVVCQAPQGLCDAAERCTGTSAVCPADGLAPSGAVCRPAAGSCDVAEVCTGGDLGCPADVKSTGVCRAAAGECDVAELCDGVGNSCPGNAFVPDGAICTGDGNACTTDVCTNGSCTHPTGNAGAVCRGPAGPCDVAETCTGASAACPADRLATAGASCRPAAGQCDIAESCTGTSANCPTDAFVSGRTLCRPAAGQCDVAESCTGVSAACPYDAKSTALCRTANGVCDLAELCNGVSNDCPPDSFAPAIVVCRAATAPCDAAERCTGASPSCPADGLSPSGTVCRAAGGPCDVAEACSGASLNCPADGFASTSVVCRPPSDPCDAVETCTGGSASCPSDLSAPNGTPCADELACTVSDQCVAGACVGVPANNGPVEVCADLADNDIDCEVDCLDSDCACEPIRAACDGICPSVLLFRPGLDKLQLRGAILPATPIDPAHEPVTLLIANDDGVVFSATLPAGSLVAAKAGVFKYLNRDARAAGGILSFRLAPIVFGGTGRIRFTIKGYGDLAAARLATMMVQIGIGDHAFAVTRDWTARGAGWTAQLP